MHWSKMLVVAGAVALSLAGCADRLSAPARAETEHVMLTQRVQALAVRVAESGTMTEEQERELDAISREILAWQRRTGRTDFSVSTSRPPVTSTNGLISAPSPTPSCLPCPPTKVSGGSICFLISGSCTKGGGRVCAYQCIYGLAQSARPARAD